MIKYALLLFSILAITANVYSATSTCSYNVKIDNQGAYTLNWSLTAENNFSQATSGCSNLNPYAGGDLSVGEAVQAVVPAGYDVVVEAVSSMKDSTTFRITSDGAIYCTNNIENYSCSYQKY